MGSHDLRKAAAVAEFYAYISTTPGHLREPHPIRKRPAGHGRAKAGWITGGESCTGGPRGNTHAKSKEKVLYQWYGGDGPAILPDVTLLFFPFASETMSLALDFTLATNWSAKR